VISANRQSSSAFHHSLLRLLAGAASPAQLRLCIDPKNYSVAAAIMPAAAAAGCNDDDARDATAPRCSDADKAQHLHVAFVTTTTTASSRSSLL